MNAHELIDKYYAGHPTARRVLIAHSQQVADLAVKVARHQLDRSTAVDVAFVEEAAWLHDIGMLQTRVPEFGCHGSAPYMAHGILGAELLEREGLSRHAQVCERHIGVGLSIADIRDQQLPLPLRDMQPQNLEETIVAYADLFYSKKGAGVRSVAEVRRSLARHGAEKVAIFDAWHARFALPGV